VAALNRIILAVALVLSFGVHQAMQCQRGSALSAAFDRCSRPHTGCPHGSTPAAPVKGCCANFACLSDAQCSGVEDTVVSQDVAQLEPVSASVSIFPLNAAKLSARVSLRFHSPPTQVPFFVAHHAFLI